MRRFLISRGPQVAILLKQDITSKAGIYVVTMPSIKSATQRCMKLFASICARSHTAPAKYSEQMTPSMLEDEYDRFKMWSGNLGALQKGHASLDWRLCDAEVMSTSILDILTILEKDLSGSKHNRYKHKSMNRLMAKYRS